MSIIAAGTIIIIILILVRLTDKKPTNWDWEGIMNGKYDDKGESK